MSPRPNGAYASWQSVAIERLKNAAFSGHGEARRQVLEAAKTPPLAESLIDRLRATFGDLKPADESDEETQLREVAELHDEEAARFAELLPRPFADALAKMPMRRRIRRIAAIKAKCQAWERSSEAKIDYINVIDADAYSLAAIAEANSRKYADKHPANKFPEPKHRKRRCEKWWRRQLKKEQLRALKYVEAAVGAVGGPSAPNRPLYVSDYMLDRYRDHKERTQEILEGLRLVKKLDPTVQIPMIEVDKRSRRAKAAKMRLWIDLQIERWTQLEWHVCWITVTLPGQYVPHSTNENRRRAEWDEALGPDEAAEQIQHLHHQTLAILKKKGIRAHGWWNSQPQQSGTPHRHYVLAAPTQAAARRICDEFRNKFSTTQGEQDGEDRGCRAYVIGDDSEKYCPPKGKDGSEETVASVAKYAARYATRYETVDTVEGDESGAEMERFSAWATSRGARKHAWLGLDSQRAPGEIWDTLWKRSDEEYTPDDPRMKLALRELRACREAVETIVESRTNDDGKRNEEETALQDWFNERAARYARRAALHAWHAGIAMGLWPDDTLATAELNWLRGEVDELGGEDPLPPAPLRDEKKSAYGEIRKEFVGAVGVTEHLRVQGKMTMEDIWDVVSASGREIELETKSMALRKWHYIQALDDHLTFPHSIKFERKRKAELQAMCDRLGLTIDPRYYQKHTVRLGVKSLKAKGFGFSTRPCGAVAIYDLSGEILMKNEDEWEILEVEAADRLKEEYEAMPPSQKPAVRIARQMDDHEKENDLHRLRDISLLLADVCEGDTPLEKLTRLVSFSPTDPSNGPAGHSTGWTEAADPPPI